MGKFVCNFSLAFYDFGPFIIRANGEKSKKKRKEQEIEREAVRKTPSATGSILLCAFTSETKKTEKRMLNFFLAADIDNYS